MIRSTRKITTTLTAAAASVALIFGMAACGASDEDCQGDPGTIKEKDWDSNGKKADDYDVTVVRTDPADIKAAGGQVEYEKDVTGTAYDKYKVGGKFPSPKFCNSDGTAK
jgi:hypothetical protein